MFYVSMVQSSEFVHFGSSHYSDVKPVGGHIDGFQIKSVWPNSAEMFPTGVNSSSVNGTIKMKFPPAEVFTVQIESFIERPSEKITSFEVASFKYCSRKYL